MKIVLLVALFALADPSAAFLAPLAAPQLRTAGQVPPPWGSIRVGDCRRRGFWDVRGRGIMGHWPKIIFARRERECSDGPLPNAFSGTVTPWLGMMGQHVRLEDGDERDPRWECLMKSTLAWT